MLKERGIDHAYREYTEKPLSLKELRGLFAKLRLPPRELLRAKEAKAAGLTGDEPDATLLAAMAKQPTLLQRPIGVLGNRAVVGRPPEALLDLFEI